MSRAAEEALRAELVVVSDVHLRQMNDERARLLVDALDRLDRSVETLILNGDIFDFCHGESTFFRQKFQGFGEALGRVAARGTRVVFVEGNHEFAMRGIGWSGVEVVEARDLIVALRSGVRIKISHGDLIVDDPWYRLFRGLVKSRAVLRVARAFPGSWLDAYAMKHASVSRAQDRYRKLNHARILEGFDRWLGEGACTHGVIGHFHVPYAERRPGGDGVMLSVDSWDRPNLLVYADQRFSRVFLRELGAPFEREPAESVFKPR